MTDTSLSEGTTLLGGRYRLGPLLGRGGSADVYRCTDLTLGREVAVKVLRDAGSDDLARHRGEIATLAMLSHPGLVTLHDAGTDSDRAWFVMECVEGQTLADRLRGGALAAGEAARIGTVLAATLAHVHSRGIVHRDIKPGNVLLGADGLVKLTDFGIALVAGEARVTRTGLAVGTAAYIAPEQVEGRPTDDRVDVYSLGLLLLESLTGQRAYTGSTVEAALARLHRQPEVPEHLPAPWRALLEEMTAREADDRPTMAEVEARLAVIGGSPLTAGAGSSPTATALLPTADPTTDVLGAPTQTVPTGSTGSALSNGSAVPWRDRTELLGLPLGVAYVLVGIAALVLLSAVLLLASGLGGGSEAPAPAPAGVAPAEPGVPAEVPADLDRLDELVQP